MTMVIGSRIIDDASLELAGIDTFDYPDFSDAHYSYAEFMDGTPLTESELEELYYQYPPDYAMVVNFSYPV